MKQKMVEYDRGMMIEKFLSVIAANRQLSTKRVRQLAHRASRTLFGAK